MQEISFKSLSVGLHRKSTAINRTRTRTDSLVIY